MCSITRIAAQVTAAVAAMEMPGGRPGSVVVDDYLVLRGLVEQLEVVGLRLLAELDTAGEAAADGSASTAAWVRRHTGCSARAAAGAVRLARRLHTDNARPLTATAALLSDGRLTVEHARAIARTTATMSPEAFAAAEPALAQAAAGLEVDVTAQVAERVRDHAETLHAANQDDPAVARRAAAEASRHLHLSRCGDMYALDALLTIEAGEALRTALEPLSVPRPGLDGADDPRTAPQRRADALGEAAEMLLRVGRLPVHGGVRPQLTVLVDLDKLLAGTARGRLPGGGELSRTDTERLGCDARVGWVATRDPDRPTAETGTGGSDLIREALRHVAPAIGGLPAEVLDAGRAQRLVSPGQRHALAIRDRGCVFPGCDRPPSWCDAHHLAFWSRGGRSDLENLVLVCGAHHKAVHDRGWCLSRAPDGTIRAEPPPIIEAQAA